MTERKYWIGEVGDTDDFGNPIVSCFVDGKTKMGPWAIMSPESFRRHGVGKYGTGYGQRYVSEANGKWVKVEG